jgi:hypothetical protein
MGDGAYRCTRSGDRCVFLYPIFAGESGAARLSTCRTSRIVPEAGTDPDAWETRLEFYYLGLDVSAR